MNSQKQACGKRLGELQVRTRAEDGGTAAQRNLQKKKFVDPPVGRKQGYKGRGMGGRQRQKAETEMGSHTSSTSFTLAQLPLGRDTLLQGQFNGYNWRRRHHHDHNDHCYCYCCYYYYLLLTTYYLLLTTYYLLLTTDY